MRELETQDNQKTPERKLTGINTNVLLLFSIIKNL